MDNSLITVKQLTKWVMEQYNGYEPLPQALHILLNKHGLIKHNKYFKGKQVTLYSTPNAKKVIAKLNRNNNHKHSDKRKHARHKDGR